MKMLEQFKNFIKKEKLFEENSKILLTVSGGVDSAVMCHLFFEAGLTFGISHCNFKLREEESDGDEKFVKELSKKYAVSFHCHSFDTEEYAKKEKISIQMSARELRYEWLNNIAKEKNYDYIATAHHLDDSIETFFINLLRGTGITGLQGVPVKQGNVIRPLLFANKKMILDYAKEEKLTWREDSSNATDKYLRNNIRHHLIPSLKKLNIGFEKTIKKELSYFKEAGEIFKKFIEEKKNEIVETEGKTIMLNIQKIKDSGYPETVLHELLRAYDFTPETTELIAQRLYTTAGKKFISPTYHLIKDRDFLILSPRTKNKTETGDAVIKKSHTKFSNEAISFELGLVDGNLLPKEEKKSSIAFLDYGKLSFPLNVRRWKQGDYFYPLGMKGKKKLSDFFIDNKIPLHKKEDIFVVLSGNDIAWVINHRIDNRFKITKNTKKMYKMMLNH